MKQENQNPVFVVGCFRSGTSLLYSLLNRHPRVALMYECNVWDFPASFSWLRFRCDWLGRQEFFNQAVSRHQSISGADFRSAKGLRTPEDLYRFVAEGKRASLWGEKSPMYGVRLCQLARRYPDASFILMWRDPVEIYRSIAHAGRDASFFARPGMLNRLIYFQEQTIRQCDALRRAGARLHHVTYDELIDRTEQACRSICEFLEIDYDAQMLDLARADFAPVFPGAHHEHLRRGVIERRRFPDALLSPHTVGKLERFGARWSRLQDELLGVRIRSSVSVEPSVAERAYHQLAGAVLQLGHNGKRLLFEFLPLTWLRTYRPAKNWMLASEHTPSSDQRHSLGQQISNHWGTILGGLAMLLGVATLQFFSNPRMVFIPLYLFPCAILTLVVSAGWGTLAAAAAAVIGPVLQSRADPDFAHLGVVVWNSAMRFVLLEIVVLLLDRVRLELERTGHGGSPTGLHGREDSLK